MAKRAIDLSVDELAAMGAKAAHAAARKSLEKGLTITGTVDVYEEGQARSILAQLHPSGVVNLLQEDDAVSAAQETPAAKPHRGKDSD